MAKNQQLKMTVEGLWTSPNTFSSVPPGALQIADNLVFYRQNVAESRRGQNLYGSLLGAAIKKLFNYKDYLLLNYGSKMAYDSDDSGTWVDYSGTYEQPATTHKIRGLESNENFYFNTTNGVYKIDALTSNPRLAGVPQGLDMQVSLTGTTGWFTDGNQVAYRILWGYRDLNSNLLLGAPSGRVVVINDSGNNTDTTIVSTIPSEVELGWFYQIYRSGLSGGAAIVPNDELKLVLEASPTALDLSNGYITAADTIDYNLSGAFLYTNSGQEGIAAANAQPPYCKDMVLFSDHSFFANTKQRSFFNLRLLGVGEDSSSFGYLLDASVDTTNASPTLAVTSTTNLRVGMRVIGTGIQTDSRILSISAPTTVTMTKNATATNLNISLEFQDRLTIDDVDYWGGSTYNESTHTFLVTEASPVDPVGDIEATSYSLIKLVNRVSANTTIYAYYLSGSNEFPGQLLFQTRQILDGDFIVTSTDGSSFTPNLPNQLNITANTLANPTVVTCTGHGLTTGNVITIYNSNSTPTIDGERTVTVLTANTFSVPVNVTVAGTSGYWVLTSLLQESEDDGKQSYVLFSKPNQPEAVPVVQELPVGSENYPILRVIALRDTLFVFKADGIFTITGYNKESFQVILLDNTIKLTCIESAAPFGNKVFCFTDQAIAVVADTGALPASIPIEQDLLRLSALSNFAQNSFGLGYESDRMYIFFTVSNVNDTYATQAFIYNEFSNAWSRWDLARTCMVVRRSDNKLYLGGASSNYVYKERKSYSRFDYADESFDVTIISSSAFDITLNSTTGLAEGMTITQGFLQAIIESINGAVITVDSQQTWVAGDAEVFTPIINTLQWSQFDVGNPGVVKQFREMTFIFADAAFRELMATFTSNFSPSATTITLSGNYVARWGRFAWGSLAWGGYLGGQSPIRTWVALDKQRAMWVNVKIEIAQAFTSLSLAGISLIYTEMSERIR